MAINLPVPNNTDPHREWAIWTVIGQVELTGRANRLYNHHIAQRGLGPITSTHMLTLWLAFRPNLFKKQVYDQSGLDVYKRTPL